MTQAVQLIDALNGTFGRHTGFRASHAKGLAVTGRFIPDSAGSKFNVPLLDTERPIAARFSIGGGKPNISDKSSTVRGIGLTIGNPADNWTLALISAPVFFANSAEQFKEFLAARAPDPQSGGPDPSKVKLFNEANPNTIPHQEYLKSTPPCTCYSAGRYHSCHAYGLQTDGGSVWARLLLDPEDGRLGLTPEELTELPDGFLGTRLEGHLTQRAARWKIKALIAQPGDELLDPTTPWAGKNEEVSLGTVEISQLDETPRGADRVFDPAHMPPSVDAPRDAVFPLRSAAYAVSFQRRST